MHLSLVATVNGLRSPLSYWRLMKHATNPWLILVLICLAALSIISTTFAEGRERARALGVWAAIAIGGSAFGLVLGGWLTQSFSWPWIFFVNVPVGVFAFFAAMRFVPESKDEHAHRS